MTGRLASCLVMTAAMSITVPTLSQADGKCKPVNRDASISRILKDHADSKVLKVDERKGANGCAYLEIRILIDGTVKAVVVKGRKSA